LHNVPFDGHLVSLHIVSATPVSKSKATAKQQSLASNVNMSTATMDLRVNEKDFKRVSAVDTIDKAMITQGWEPAALYVFGDKSNLKVRLYARMIGHILYLLQRIYCRCPFSLEF
jgi:hypothetical protein